MNQARSTRTTAALVSILAVYAAGRILEVASGNPRTWIVAIEVLSALAFALVDGARHYGWRSILLFAGICAVIGNVVENIGVATGFPFGRYEFLELMGPKLFHVPVLLGLAYIGMAYVSWMLARLIISPTGAPLSGARTLVLSIVASIVMTTWDWAQDPVWATLLHGWRWQEGGSWFGVPVSNYVGWLGTLLLIYLTFALYHERLPEPSPVPVQPRALWPPIAFYALCAAGNALQLFTRLPQQVVSDPAGKLWRTADILAASAVVSIVVMGAFVLAAAQKLTRIPSPQARKLITDH
jgi:uncharacterized membrane protein